EQDGEQGAGGAEADPLRLGGGNELGLAVVVEDDGQAQLRLGVGEAALDLGKTALEFGAAPRRLGAVEGGSDGVGLSVEGLAGAVAVTGEGGDGATGPKEDGVGAGEALLGG